VRMRADAKPSFCKVWVRAHIWAQDCAPLPSHMLGWRRNSRLLFNGSFVVPSGGWGSLVGAASFSVKDWLLAGGYDEYDTFCFCSEGATDRTVNRGQVLWVSAFAFPMQAK
jgi:hypothetical protein